MSAQRKKLILTPECYRLWAISPSLLLTHNLVMDSRDFEDAQAKKDWSSYHKLISEALLIYREEGMIELEEYSAFLSATDRKFIHNYAKQLVNKQNEKDLLDYGKHAYQEYTSYQTEKLSYYRTDESIYVDEVRSRNETLSHLKQLEDATAIPSNFNFKEVMARIVAKTLAGMHLSMQFDIPMHDTEEYRPAVSWILKDCLLTNQNQVPKMIATKSKSFAEKITHEIFEKIIHPELRFHDMKSLPLIIEKRKDFDHLSSCLSEIDALYKEARTVTDEKELIDKIVCDVEIIEAEIEKEVKKIQSKPSYKIPWTLYRILTTIKIPYLSILDEKLEELSKERIRLQIESKYPHYCWFFNFKKIGEHALTITDINKFKSSNTPQKVKTWIRGNLPWYEKIDN